MRHFYLIALATVSVVSSSQAMNGPKKKKNNLFKNMMQLGQLSENMGAAAPLLNLATTFAEKKLGQMDEQFAREGEKMKSDYTIALKKVEIEEQKADSEAKRVQSQMEFMQTMLKQSQQESTDKSKIIERLFSLNDPK